MFWHYATQATPPAAKAPEYWYGHRAMMWGGNGAEVWIFGVLFFVCWVVFIALMISVARWFWYKADREKKGR